VNRWLGLAALVALAAVGLYVALVQTSPIRVFPGVPEPPSVSRTTPIHDAGSIDELLDAKQIEHALGGR
jgi:hypothetical protein